MTFDDSYRPWSAGPRLPDRRAPSAPTWSSEPPPAGWSPSSPSSSPRRRSPEPEPAPAEVPPSEIVFRPTTGFRMARLVMAGLFVATGAAFLSWGEPGVALIDMLLAAANVGLFYRLAGFGVALDAEGITLEGVTTRRYAWRQVYAIEPVWFFGERQTRIDLMNGTSVRTHAPRHSLVTPDRDFEAKVAALQRYHRAHRYIGPPPTAAAAHQLLDRPR